MEAEYRQNKATSTAKSDLRVHLTSNIYLFSLPSRITESPQYEGRADKESSKCEGGREEGGGRKRAG